MIKDERSESCGNVVFLALSVCRTPTLKHIHAKQPPVYFFFICSACLFLFTCVSVRIGGTPSVNWAFIKLSSSQLSAELIKHERRNATVAGDLGVKIAQRGASTFFQNLCVPLQRSGMFGRGAFPSGDVHPPKGYRLIVAHPSIALSNRRHREQPVFGRRSMQRIGLVKLRWQMLTRVFRCDLSSG